MAKRRREAPPSVATNPFLIDGVARPLDARGALGEAQQRTLAQRQRLLLLDGDDEEALMLRTTGEEEEVRERRLHLARLPAPATARGL
jgi:hypothetical protein